MAAVPIYVWNGSAWQETGPTIPANPIKYQASAPSSPSTGDIWVDSDGDVTTGSQQFQRFRFVASGGETTISGADANGAVLAYTAGLEQVVLNGAVLVRGQDYTATTGTTITGLSPALVASDVLEVFSFIAFTVANTYTQSQVDGLVNAANDAIGMKLLVPTSVVNGTVSASGTVSFSAASSVSVNDIISATYKHYIIYIDLTGVSADGTSYLKLRVSGTDASTGYYYAIPALASSGATAYRFANPSTGGFEFGQTDAGNNAHKYSGRIDLFRPFETVNTTAHIQFVDITTTGTVSAGAGGGHHDSNTSYTGFTIYPSAGNFTGTVKIFGVKE